MAKTMLSLSRVESYTLLIAEEFLRRGYNWSNSRGTPLISLILPQEENREYTKVLFSYHEASDVFQKMPLTLVVQINAGGVWPKEGSVLVGRVDMCRENFLSFPVKLVGNPGAPTIILPDNLPLSLVELEKRIVLRDTQS